MMYVILNTDNLIQKCLPYRKVFAPIGPNDQIPRSDWSTLEGPENDLPKVESFFLSMSAVLIG